LKPSATHEVIPALDISALFGARTSERERVDAALRAAAGDQGFLIITGLPADVPLGAAARRELLRVFALDAAARRQLWRRKFEPRNMNVYRGWFPAQPGNLTSKEGTDIGADIAHGAGVIDDGDPLCEATPMPPAALLPGWRAAVACYYLSMERVAGVLMQALARTLGLRETYFDAAFRQGLSTLRLLQYPLRTREDLDSCTDPELWVSSREGRLHVVGAAHTDSGFMTLLAQDGVSGLQARSPGGSWTEVPPLENSLVVNFGQVLEAWSGGRIRATEHRVLSSGQVRHSIPFFYEARAEARISPLPGDEGRFEPFLYGDYLWSRITSFVEFRGMASQRRARGAGVAEPGSA
jgi:isopenicillin N synthase-like dioxygenase